MRAQQTECGDLAIFERLLAKNKDRMSPQLSRHVLTLGFGEDDQSRMSDLAARNQSGLLSSAEKAELQSYVTAGHFLALLHSQARLSLKKRKNP